MILKKLNVNCFVILADEKTLSNNGDWYLSHPDYNKAVQWNMPLNTQHEGKQVWINKILYSTQPLEQYYGTTDGTVPFVYHKIKQLSLSEVEEAINGYTPMQLARQSAVDNNYDIEDDVYKHGFVEGFKAHQELVKDKLFTVEDIKEAILMAWEADSIDGTVDLNVVLHYGNNNDLRTKWSEEEIIQSLLPKTEWNVEIVNGKLKLI